MDTRGWKIILGSNSPRRKELMSGLDILFSIDTGNTFTEAIDESLPPEEVPVRMAVGKSHGFHRGLAPDEILVTADTVVVVDGRTIGKPHSREEALSMLRSLSGKTHEVITAVTLRSLSHEETISDTTTVSFREMTDSEMDYYVDTYKPYDKAGAYGVQEWIGFVAIDSIIGSFYNVMGFPVHKVYGEIAKFVDYGIEQDI